MKLIAISIVAANRVIGDGFDQPFKFAEDFARFKRVTMGHPLILGRKTHEAMGLLPGRFSIVLTSKPQDLAFPDDKDGNPRGRAVSSLEEAIAVASELDDVAYVLGGGQVYRQAMSYLDEIDLTEVPQDAEGVVTFPKLGEEWREVSRDPRDEFDFVTYRRAR